MLVICDRFLRRCCNTNFICCILRRHNSTRRSAMAELYNTKDPSVSDSVQTKESEVKVKQQTFKYFLVLDFEATCDDKTKLIPQEIIEFPVLKVNSETLQTESIFHQYVQPRVHKELTPFCMQLTGIIQDMVDGQPHLEEVLQKFHAWMLENQLLDQGNEFAFVTCGDWDLKTMLPSQCRHFNIYPQKYFKQWINIKKSFSDVTSTYPRGMMNMLSQLNITHEGRHHSGIDDCKNISKIVVKLLEKGYIFKVNGQLR